MSLLDQWLAVVPGGEAAGAPAGADLLARWSEPGRRYHTADHLSFMLSIVDEADPAGADLTAVRLAAWFHDAVYDPRGTDNECASADLAQQMLPPLAVAPSTVAEVVRLVLLTADHRVAPGDVNGALLVDADLAILGTPPARYRAYADAIRAEYAHVPDDAFRAGRSTVLGRLLSLDVLFHLAPHRAAWDAPARDNMRAELAALAT